MESEAKQISQLISSSKHCVVFTGAGISTAAGIGDYRGKSGKWTSDDLQEFVSTSKYKCLQYVICGLILQKSATY